MNRPNVISRAVFSLLTLIIQQASTLHIKQIRNESSQQVTITYCQQGVEEEMILILTGNSTMDVNLTLPESKKLVETRLEEAEHYLKIATYQAIFVCIEGKIRSIDKQDHICYGAWMQKLPTRNNKCPRIKILSYSYGLKNFGNIHQDIISQEQEPRPEQISKTLTIDKNGAVW